MYLNINLMKIFIRRIIILYCQVILSTSLVSLNEVNGGGISSLRMICYYLFTHLCCIKIYSKGGSIRLGFKAKFILMMIAMVLLKIIILAHGEGLSIWNLK